MYVYIYIHEYIIFHFQFIFLRRHFFKGVQKDIWIWMSRSIHMWIQIWSYQNERERLPNCNIALSTQWIFWNSYHLPGFGGTNGRIWVSKLSTLVGNCCLQMDWVGLYPGTCCQVSVCPVLIADKPANTFPCRCFNWALVLVINVGRFHEWTRFFSQAQGLMNVKTLWLTHEG